MRQLLVLGLLLCACDGDDDVDDNGNGVQRDAAVDASRPAHSADAGTASSLFLEGMAMGSVEDGGADHVECRFSATIDMLERDANGDFTGFAVGELFRTTYVGDGMFEFAPFIGGPASLSHIGDGDTVELRFVGDQPDDALEFWKELEVVTGEDQGEGRYGGDWVCAPGLLGNPGFMDIDLNVPGEWSLGPGP